jgi:hypothetical protein
VLSNYVADYFDKELVHIRTQYSLALRKAVDDIANTTGRVVAGTLLQPPQLRAEKMKSISNLVKTVANRNFINSILSITTDAALRMESIGRDDRKLYSYIKDLYILQLGFLIDGVMLPCSKTCTTMLLKLCATKSSSTTMPSLDLLAAVSALIYTKNKLKSHFDTTFTRTLSSSANLVLICKEVHRKAFSMLVSASRECLYSWTLSMAYHIEKLLTSIQSKYDYAVKVDPIQQMIQQAQGGNRNSVSNKGNNFMIQCTAACEAVCKAINVIISKLREFEDDLKTIDIDLMFWRPFGQTIIGNLISHLRKQKITTDGAKVLLRDIQEYKRVRANISVILFTYFLFSIF